MPGYKEEHGHNIRLVKQGTLLQLDVAQMTCCLVALGHRVRPRPP